MGATSLDFKIHRRGWEFTFPHEVFGSENLIRLSVSGCRIGLGPDRKVKCWRLKSLTLKDVSSDIIWDVISSCPLIENLSLSSPSTSFVDWPVILDEFRKLKSLLLYDVDVPSTFFNDFSCKFPCLKELVLHLCGGYRRIQISCPSLECISIRHEKNILRANFDVPNICKFTFSGSNIPLLSFCNTTSNWKSEICIKRRRYLPSTAWFLELNKLLNKLSPSKVSLSLDVLSEKSLDWAGNIHALPKAQVENLTIKVPHLVYPAFFYGLFRCCCPKYVTTKYWFPKSYKGGEKTHDFMEFVFKRMMPQVTLNSCIAYQRLSGEYDLKEVSVEFYDEFVSAWRPQLSDVSTNLGADEQRTRVHLKWGR